jgi:hypothetical protein
MNRVIFVAMAILVLVAACAPPGITSVTYQGVTVFVPSSWGHNNLHCGTPVRDTVVVNPGPQPLCMVYPPPRVSYVRLRSCTDCGVDPEAAVARQAVRVSGRAARRGEDRLPDGRTRVVLVYPDRSVVVVAVSVDPGVARSIVDSASIS